MPCVAVVDDDDDARDSLCGLFEDAGYRCVSAPSVDRAVHLLRSVKCDLVVTDFAMPDKDGAELVRELRTLPLYTTTPVIVLSGSTRHDWSDPKVVFVLKPPEPEQLVELARKLIEAA